MNSVEKYLKRNLVNTQFFLFRSLEEYAKDVDDEAKNCEEDESEVKIF